MRYKPKQKSEFHPVKLNLSDLEHMLELAGAGAKLSLETRRCEFDGIDDVSKHLFRSTRLTSLVINFSDIDQLTVIPMFFAMGERAEKAAPKLEEFLCDNRRRPTWIWALFVAILVVWGFSILYQVGYHQGLHKLTAGSFVPSSVVDVALGLPYGAAAYILVRRILFGNVLVPLRADAPWWRRHREVLMITVAGAVATAVATALASAWLG